MLMRSLGQFAERPTDNNVDVIETKDDIKSTSTPPPPPVSHQFDGLGGGQCPAQQSRPAGAPEAQLRRRGPLSGPGRGGNSRCC